VAASPNPLQVEGALQNGLILNQYSRKFPYKPMLYSD
jgi:hypothetical protein